MALTTVAAQSEPQASPRTAAPDAVSYVGGVVGIITGVAGLVLNLLTLNELSKSPQITSALFWPTIHLVVMYFIVTNCLFLLGISVALFVYRNKLRQSTRLASANVQLEGSLSSFHRVNRDISHERMIIAYMHTEFCAQLRRRLQRNDSSGVMDDLERYLDQTLTHVAHLFSIYTDDDCAACVKMFSISHGDKVPLDPDAEGKHPPYVYTFKRDGGSTHLRKDVDTAGNCQIYEYAKNAAFFYVLDRNQHPDFFVSDDLLSLEAEGKYWNENERWRELYNATTVVPIRMSFQSVDEHCLGLLCVDNKKGGFDTDYFGLHRERCVHILNGIGADLYYAIRTAVALASLSQTGTAHAR